MTLKALQAKWRAIEESRQDSGQAHVRGWAEGHSHCADALTPHILQQERDRELMSRLLAVVEKSPGSFPWLCDAVRSRLKEME